MWKRILRLLSPLLTNRWLYISFITAIFEQAIIYFTGLIPSKMNIALTGKNQTDFQKWLLVGVVGFTLNSLIRSAKAYFADLTYIKFRSALTTAGFESYFLKNNFYNLCESSIDNADQRLTMDIDKFARQMIDLITVVTILPFTIAFYMYKCVIYVSWGGALASVLFFIIAAVTHSLILPKVVFWAKKIEEHEGDYRWSHAKIRSNGEAICMYEAENTEKSLLASLGNVLFQTQRSHAVRSFFLKWSVHFFDLNGGLVAYMCLGPLVFGGKYSDVPADELSGIISVNSFQIGMLIYEFGKLLREVSKISDIIACGERISDLLEYCKDSPEPENKSFTLPRISNNRDDQTDFKKEAEDVLELSNLDVRFKSTTLISNITLSLVNNENLMITGPNGSGKSSIFRSLKGLWRTNLNARIRLLTDSMFLSQYPYVTDGCLLYQITYPQRDLTIDARKRAMNALKIVGLGSLQMQIDDEKNWGRCLSFGEQQKIALARVFFRKPRLVFLDESTSGIPEEEETEIYKELMEQDITFVSIVHRSNLAKFHVKHLKICSDGNYTISTI